MAFLLSFNGSIELLRAHLMERFGPDVAYPLTGLPSPPVEQNALTLPAVLNGWTGRPASNAWVVSGARTASGKPLLASDPHLPLAIPSIWYEIHLNGDGLNVAGASIPGIPFVIIGRNERIAWG
jgi:penicillin amidase